MLDLNNKADLELIINNLENTMTKDTIELNATMLNTITMRLMAKLVRKELCSAKQAIAASSIFAQNLQVLLDGDSDGWLHHMAGQLDSATVNGEEVKAFPLLPILKAINYIDIANGGYVVGKKVYKMLLQDLRATAPTLVGEELVRMRGYSTVKHGEVFEQAIHVLESTEFTVSTNMLEIAREVYIHATPELKAILDNEMYVLKGCAKMNPLSAYISEFFGDKRGRMYQAAYYGPNGQTSDMSRSLMDLHSVSTDYDINDATVLLIEEIGDMFSGSDEELEAYMEMAVSEPVKFIAHHVEHAETSCVKKPWNFVKAAQIIAELRVGNRPYIGIAVGYDAKCSGPQLGAAMVACESMLVSCGFTVGELTDAYTKAVEICERDGIPGMTRNGIKKAFMAVYYGAGWVAMMDKDTIEDVDGCHTILWSQIDLTDDDAVERQARKFHECINKAFGEKLRMLRGAVKSAGYDFNEDICKYNKPVRHTLADGFEVAMDYRLQLNIDDEVILMDTPTPDAVVEYAGMSKRFQAPKFNTDDFDLEAYGRKGFVNMIQGVDALIARLIILHANRLGAQHIISVHDCFRVNIHDTAILKQAIVCAYQELFGSLTNEPTMYLKDLDMLKQYFEGSKAASKPEYQHDNRVNVQFYSNGNRVLRNVNGTKFSELAANIDGTQYFGK